MVRGFWELVDLGVKHFEGTYHEPNRVNLEKILKLISCFPRMVNDDDNQSLYSLMTKEDLNTILLSFKKEWIPSIDGWSMEFYIEIF